MSVFPKIVMNVDADFTPPGKRRSRMANFYGNQYQIRWYVGGRTYRKLPVSVDNIKLTREWLDNPTTKKYPLMPQTKPHNETRQSDDHR